ncbi:MAG: cation-translocating P-type ATPase [Clostridium sp.]|nr:cation-translocating P-type ATPase [Clostridium sp.]MCM1547032.1 cation-translocating P-type ATPase [Ruminococcus sp.]
MNDYLKSKEEIMKELETSADGLSSVKAAKNTEKYGKNEITGEKKKSTFVIFLEQFKDFLVIILIAAAIVSAILGDIESTVVILAVITMNAVLGTVQTVNAAKSLDSLKKLSAPNAKVLRDGQAVVIPSENVTVGDIVLLEAGDYICADGRIIENASLKVNESALTGESLNVEKEDTVFDKEIPLGDRLNMVYSGSFVTYGRAKFAVTGIGMETEVGKIAGLINSAKERKTPLQVSLDNFGKKLSFAILGVCILVFALSVFRGEEIMNAFLFAVALAVAAIPEALSSIVTIVLSFGTQKMSKENAIMRKLQAVEGLGSVSIICSDKTGTLTQNKMTVKKFYVDGDVIDCESGSFDKDHQKRLLLSSILCNDAVCKDGEEIGDPTETALVNFGTKYGFNFERIREKYPRISEIPFDSDRKLMTTVHRVNGTLTMLTKGATDVLLERMILSDKEKENIKTVTEQLSQLGLRLLCFAYKEIASENISLDDENDLTFMGLIAMMDPPREESKAAVEECISAGIKPVMITGDHKVTAAAIAKEIGILKDFSEAAEGAEIDDLTDEQLKEYVPTKSVYARVSPEHKIRIVRAWQERGNIVAMTGDGVNDAPALKQADIGVAMGITGTEVSKDAASMVLADDNFATIVKAVNNGRNIYANIKRSIQFLLSGNAAGILVVLFASLAALPVPFAAVHLLFINLLTDSLPAIALGLEPHSKDVMKQKPRPIGESILTKPLMLGIISEGLIIAAAAVVCFMFGLKTSNEVGSTMAFASICLSRLIHGFNCKSETPVLFTKKFFNNKAIFGAFFIGLALLSAVLFIPGLSGLFKAEALTGVQIGMIAGTSVGTLIVIQLLKLVRKIIKNK